VAIATIDVFDGPIIVAMDNDVPVFEVANPSRDAESDPSGL
jgi:hypothetical protein